MATSQSPDHPVPIAEAGAAAGKEFAVRRHGESGEFLTIVADHDFPHPRSGHRAEVGCWLRSRGEIPQVDDLERRRNNIPISGCQTAVRHENLGKIRKIQAVPGARPVCLPAMSVFGGPFWSRGACGGIARIVPYLGL